MDIRKTGRGAVVTGMFVLAAIGIIIFLAFKPIREVFRPDLRYFAYIDNVGQLKEGDQVTIRGFGVGKVVTIEPAFRGQDEPDPALRGTPTLRVAFGVRDDPRIRVKSGAAVAVEANSILGGAHLELTLFRPGTPMDERSYADPAGDHDRNRAIPVGASSDILATVRKVNQLLEEQIEPGLRTLNAGLEKVMDRVLSDVNIEHFNRIIADLETLANDLPGHIDRLVRRLDGEVLPEVTNLLQRAGRDVDALAADAQGLIADLRGTAKNVDRTLGTAERELVRLSDSLNAEVLPRISSLADDLQVRVAGTLENANDLVDDLQETIAVLRPDLTRLLVEGRDTLVEVKLLSRSLRSDPSSLLWGPTRNVVGPTRPYELELRNSGRARPYEY